MPAIDLTLWLLVFLRVSAMFTLFPIFSIHNVPVRLRTAMAAMVAILTAAAIPTIPALADNFWLLLGVCASEVGIGLVLGFVSRIVFYGLDFAGSLIATEIGLSMPPVMDPMTGGQSTPPTSMLHYLATMLWLSMDLHHWTIQALQKTYALLPIGGMGWIREAAMVEIIRRTGETFWMSVQMAAPVMAVSFLITLMLSVLGRAVPQMNVFGESFAIRILGGLIVFGMTFHLLAEHITNYLRRLPDDVLRMAQLIGAA